MPALNVGSTDRSDARGWCDALYQLVGSPEWESLRGATRRDIAARLGLPDQIATLVHDGITWTRIVYRCETLPAGASPEERAAFDKGWRFAPSLLFRDDAVVDEAVFQREVLGDRRTAVPPPDARFSPGGRFP